MDPDDRQLAFEDLETAVAEAEAARDTLSVRNADGSPKRPVPKRHLGHPPDHLPRIEEVIEPKDKVCPCGCTDMVQIGEDRSERLDIIPARFQVIVTLERRSGLARMNSSGGRIQGDQGPEGRPRYACRRCDGGVLQAEPLCAIGSRTMASAPARLIEGGLPTEGTLAHVIVSK